MLADPQVPVNIDIMKVDLPLNVMFTKRDSQMTRLFLQSHRIDWLAPAWNRNLRNLEQNFGIKYLPELDSFKNKTSMKTQFSPLAFSGLFLERNNLDYFYYLDFVLERDLPEESALIYERIIEELVKATETEDYSRLLFRTAHSIIAFKIALKYHSDTKCRDDEGNTLLHISSCPEVCKLLLEMGADINALNDSEDTPFMSVLKLEHYETAQFLDENRANVKFINSQGFSALHFCSSHSGRYDFEISESFFRDLLQKGAVLFYHKLESVFNRYPTYRDIFNEDLPANLAVTYFNDNLKYNYQDWTDQDRLRYLMMFFSKTNDNIFSFPSQITSTYQDLIRLHANDLFHFVAKKSNSGHALVDQLISDYGADPNCLIDGKTPLFVASLGAMKSLIQHRSDPFLKIDGLLVFERENLFSESSSTLDGSWLISLYSKGFDLFSSRNKTGKSLLGYFDSNIQINFYFDIGLLCFPVKKISKMFFEVLAREKVDFLSPIDDEGNSCCHYLCADESYQFLREYLNLSQLANSKNNSGISALRVFVERDKDFKTPCYIESNDDWETYLNECRSLYGADFMERYGLYILNSLCTYAKGTVVLENLLKNFDFPTEIIVESRDNGPLDSYLFKCSTHLKCQSAVSSLLDHGFTLTTTGFLHLVQNNLSDLLVRVIDDFEDINELIHTVSVSSNYNELFALSSSFRKLYKHSLIILLMIVQH